MTNSQQQIIDSIKLEFDKINNAKSYGGNLIDIDEILGDIDKDKSALKEMEINNNYQIELIKQRIKIDIDILNEDLKKIGLIAIKDNHYSININVNGYRKGPLGDPIGGIRISYDMSSSYKQLTNGNGYTFYNGFGCLSSYVANPNRKIEYKDLQQLASKTEFKSAIRRLYESSLNK